MKHSDWAKPTDNEVKELEYTQLEDGNGTSNSNSNGNNGNNGNGNPNVPVSGGIGFVLLLVLIWGYLITKKNEALTK
jgi:hypothetical protein